MSISIRPKTDYSSLLSSLPQNNTRNMTSQVLGGSADMTSLLSDYSAIKNGSYSKLVKAAYTKDASQKVSSDKKSEDTEKTDKTDTTAKKDTKADIVSINGKEINLSEIDLSKSKVPDKSKTVYSSNATRNFTDSTGNMFDSII